MEYNHRITTTERVFDALIAVAAIAIWFAICCAIASRLATII